MNKIKLILTLLFLLNIPIFSQYTLVIKLVESDGKTPNTGEASNIEFTSFPHSYPTDIVSGITVTESGTTGTYKAKGFTDFRYVKMWLSGVEYTAFDSIQVGDVKAYMLSNYISKTTTQTGISGTKSLTGDWVYTNGTQTLFKPYVSNSNPWLTDYSLLTNTMLTPKVINDSLYGNGGKFFYTGGKLYLHSGIKLYGTGGTQPFQINTTQFDWDATDGLELDNPVQFDSVTIKEDTTISESNYSKIWSIHRNHWSEIDSMRLWMTYYNTYANTRDSFQVINNAVNLQEKTFIKTVDSTAITALDTITFPSVGQWQVIIPFEYEFQYVTPNNSGYDSLFIGVYEGDTYDLDNAQDYAVFKVAFNSGVPFGQRGRGQLVFNKLITPGNLANVFYIAGITSGICHTSGGSAKVWFRRVKVEMLKVR
jgi:hypothetical protein